MTGQRKVLSSGLVAIDIFGKVPQEENDSNSAMLELDLFGIKDPTDKLSKKGREQSARECFFETLKYTKEGRYEVHLPWWGDCVPLPNSFELAKRRLHSTTTKLLSECLYEDYEKILMQGRDEGIIEEFSTSEIKMFGNSGHRVRSCRVFLNKDFSNPIIDIEEQRRGDNVSNSGDLRYIFKKTFLDQMKDTKHHSNWTTCKNS
ncbi:u6 small nuclear RNA-methyltransferase [Caerostris extrusa]|uniref:U6 small nuclear RNA-methyltransferase n=1 Tax=Caerostris extrusa TaxID=172846 RepID=A0AAV4PMC0_CAEEX|nr:u6 small nuclear RNA-methyltransferase [Caerostris extrusa]